MRGPTSSTPSSPSPDDSPDDLNESQRRAALLETVQTALEELRVAGEEIRVQAETLVATQQMLEHEKKRYQDLFEFAPDGYLVTDLAGVIVEANAAVSQMLAIQSRFLIGKPMVLFVADEERAAFRSLVSGLPQRGQAEVWEVRLKPRSDASELYPASATVTTIVDPGTRQPTGLRWLIRPADRRGADESARMQVFSDEVVDYAIILHDPAGRVVSWNSGAENLFGYARQEMVGQFAARIFTPEDRARGVPEQEMETARTEGRANDDRWHLRKDGSRFFASGVMTALYTPSGGVRGFAKVLRDVTAQKQAEEALLQAYQRERHVASTLQAAMLLPIRTDAFPGIQIAHQYQAALEEARVGGDFYDAFLLRDGKIALVVADASGKGLAAATRTAEVKHALRAFLREDPDPARALSRLNDFVVDAHQLDDRREGEFVTLSLAVVDLAIGEVAFALAGGEPPLLIEASENDADHYTGFTGASIAVSPDGIALGILPNQTFETVYLGIFPGDILLLVTDGITEARRNTNGRAPDLLGFDGFATLAQETIQTLFQTRKRPNNPGGARPIEVDVVAHTVLERVRNFASNRFRDDVCLLVAQAIPTGIG